MFITRKHLPRRTFLRGLGTAIALPVLDSMTPAFAGPGVNSKVPNRLLFTYVPIGAVMNEWTPEGIGKDFQFKRVLKPLEAFRDEICILGGLDHHNGNALVD
ncbi:MAG: DUF1552 domain-containing protein, partial [Bryobacteraceae bacterium]|nr:DUF1552 domain-containing protein [Bryobacteraceae bacterium]